MTIYRKTRSCITLSGSGEPLELLRVVTAAVDRCVQHMIQVIPDESIPRGEAVLISKNSAGKVVDVVKAVNLDKEEKRS